MKLLFNMSLRGGAAGTKRRLILMTVPLLLLCSWLLFQFVGGSSDSRIDLPPPVSGESPAVAQRGCDPMDPLAAHRPSLGAEEDQKRQPSPGASGSRKGAELTNAKPIPPARRPASEDEQATFGSSGALQADSGSSQAKSFLPPIRDTIGARSDMDAETAKLMREIKRLEVLVEIEELQNRLATLHADRAETQARARGASGAGGAAPRGPGGGWPKAAVRMVMLSDCAAKALVRFNGSSFYVGRGDRVGDATVRAIGDEGITLALNGRTRMYPMPPITPTGELPKEKGSEEGRGQTEGAGDA